jgi:hypothetical protein
MEVVDQRISVIKTSVSNPDTERIYLCLKKLSIARRARTKAVSVRYRNVSWMMNGSRFSHGPGLNSIFRFMPHT